MDKIKTSVVLCTYNGEKFIEEQLNSILAQSHLPNEIIIIDDCSTDNTLKLINKFENKLIKIISHKNNIGVTRSFEEGINTSSGDLIFLCDQDDIWYPEKINTFINTFNETNPTVLFSDAELIDAEGSLINNRFLEKLNFNYKEKLNILKGKSDLVFCKRNIVSGSMMAFAKSLKSDILPLIHDIPNLLHDRFIASIASATNPESIVYIDECLSKYRVHNNQAVGFSPVENNSTLTDKQSYFEKEAEIIEIILERAENKHFRRAHYFWHMRAKAMSLSFLSKLITLNTLYLEGDYKRFLVSGSPFKSFISDLFKK